jgi:uncharacterized membrane protein
VNRTAKLAEIAVFAALYAVLTWVFAPISYQVFQFRVSEALKGIVTKRGHLVWAFVLGNALSNVFSPFVGPWELLWMPLMNLVGGASAWIVGSRLSGMKGVILGNALYALWVAFGVSFMLHALFSLPFPLLFVYMLIPELVLIIGFSPVMNKVNAKISATFR